MADDKIRCFGSGVGHERYADYHDNEWGIPVFDDRHLFEMLILEGAQAGLNWELILNKREGYREAFHSFEPSRVAAMSDEELAQLALHPGIVRNRLKIRAARTNARVFLNIQQELGSFSDYLWSFVGHQPKKNHCLSLVDIPCVSVESESISKDLKKRGMTFVGPKIIYSYMQAVGLVNDHWIGCWCYGR